nr:MAG TPA: baseplate protein [Caudoviricetes sp.]
MGKILKNGTEYGLGGKALIDRIYPVGSIYISTSSTFNPQNVWGGTWKKTADGRCLIGANSTYPLGSTGGSATHTHSTKDHTLTVGEMPNHTHRLLCMENTYPQGGGTTKEAKIPYVNATPTPLTIEAEGRNEPHNHGDTGSASTMQPYLAVYIWERIA